VARLLDWLLAHPWRVAALVMTVTLVLAAWIPRLSTDTSPESLMVRHDPARQDYDWFVDRFGTDTAALIVVKAEDVFAAPVLDVIRRLSDAAERLDDVTGVHSLTTVRTIRGEDDTLTTTPLVDRPVPRDRAALERIRRDALRNRVLVGSLVAADARATAVVVHAAPRPGDPTFDRRLAAQIDALIDRTATPGVTLYQFGGPITNATLASDIRRDLLTFLPLSAVVLVSFLFVMFRVAQGAVVPLVTGALSIVWTLGLMAILGVPLNILTTIVPAVLIVIGSAEDVHVLTEYHRLLRTGAPKLDAIRLAMRRCAWPIIVTTATTVVGFGSVATSTIPAQIHFGYASAVGLTANFVVTVIVLPLLLRLCPVPAPLRAPAPEPAEGAGLARLVQRLGAFDLTWRGSIAVATVALLGASLVGWWHLRVNTDQIDFYLPGSPMRMRAEDLYRSLTGFSTFHVVFDTGRPGGITEPAVLNAIVGTQEFLAGLAEIDETVGVTDYLRVMHREMANGDPAFETVPPTREAVAQYLLALEGPELARYVDFEASAASLTVHHHMTGSWQLAELLGRLRAHVATHVPAEATVRFTGRAVLLRNASDALAVNELVSLVTTFALIGAIHSLFFQSIRIGLLSLVPNAAPVLLVYGIMGLLGIPLDLATALIATLAIGIAVDDTVHHLVAYRRELDAHGDRRLAVFNTLRSQARPILYVSLALAAGFFVFAFSRFAPVIHFGILSGTVMLIALAGELVLTPVVIYSAIRWSPRWRQERPCAPAPWSREGDP
jgi:predicted RND superfamily exporter protein